MSQTICGRGPYSESQAVNYRSHILIEAFAELYIVQANVGYAPSRGNKWLGSIAGMIYLRISLVRGITRSISSVSEMEETSTKGTLKIKK